MKWLVGLGVVISVGAVAGFKDIDGEKTARQDQMANGKKLYNQWCLACHQADGSGVPNLNPPLKNTDWVTGDKTRLINVILKGLNETITVGGEEYTNPMPAQNHLKDEQIADILTYIRNSFGNKASAITAAEVKAVRSGK